MSFVQLQAILKIVQYFEINIKDMPAFKTSSWIPAILCLFFFNCSSPTNDSKKTDQIDADTMPGDNLKIGGLYIFTDNDSSFYAVKILALDSFAVHVRTYGDKFKSIPQDLNSNKLQILIGHAPLSKEGFLKDNPRLIKIENVSDEELEGYKIYLEEMKKGSN